MKIKVFKFLMVLFGYDRSIQLSNHFHSGRKDTLQLSELITNTASSMISVSADCTDAKCICCKNKKVITLNVQVGQYTVT